ncbi:MarR family winged helix-turn-helix transcriptional regulator [Luteimicrobium subarcticum]|uniref:MarR family transcriptional regulator n=1 Tax=Luteimicrobium subarcticum TaxID=620910 RepID=A0A2M8WTG0_9MICO|nr:MarR family transcriptional regulator [Luteimicrobium subarcticum]PJI94169.1 MarR family transcriptional regulator [Luteimicrobium subarcticum]
MTGAPDRAAEDDLADLLVRVVGRVIRRIRPTADDLSAGHFSVLATLERQGPQRVGDLARTERMAAPSMTRVVGALDERGLVARVRSDADARSVLVSITEPGRTLLATAQEQRAATVRDLLGTLADDDVAALRGAAGALSRLADAASDRDGAH